MNARGSGSFIVSEGALEALMRMYDSFAMAFRHRVTHVALDVHGPSSCLPDLSMLATSPHRQDWGITMQLEAFE